MEYEKYAPILLRLSLSGVFLWFGINQLLNTQAWIPWLTQRAAQIPLEASTIILINGSFEVIFGLLLLIGLYTRIVAILLGIHLLGIAFSIGYSDVAVRDVGLALATFAISLHGVDSWTLDKRLRVE